MIRRFVRFFRGARFFREARFFPGASSGQTDALTQQVVEASVAGVCERVARQIDTMSLSEARGYVRARASEVVARETRLAISHFPKADRTWSTVIARAATERLVSVVLRQMSIGVPRPPAQLVAA